MTGSFLLHLFAFISVLVRMSAIILYFAPTLGLLNLLMHWKMGKIPGIYNIMEYFYSIPNPRESKYFKLLNIEELRGEKPSYQDFTEMMEDMKALISFINSLVIDRALL